MIRRLFILLLVATTAASGAAERTPAVAGLTYSGDQAALEALDRDVAAAGTDRARLATLEGRLLALLRRSDLTFAARQAVCQRLGTVLATAAPAAEGAALKTLGAMLAEERDSDLARLALEPAPGAAVDDLFLQALGKSSARTRLGIIDSLGRRRVQGAVPALAKLLTGADTATAAAAHALGQIGSTAAETALRSATGVPAPVVAQARLDATVHLPAADATRVLRELQDQAGLPAPLRAAAFRRSLEVQPADSASRLTGALDGQDWAMKQAALEALASHLTKERAQAVLSRLSQWDAPTQCGVIAALARAGESSAVPAITAATRHASAEVRSEAFTALGMLPGSRDTVELLARTAAGETSEARLARQSLARLNGPGVSAAILAGAERGETALRVVFIEQLALRNMGEAVAFLRRCRDESDASIRAAAVGALGELAPFAEQKTVLDWAVAATDDAEQGRALRAVVNVTLRDPAAGTRGRAVYQAIEGARTEVALRLLPALARLGGAASAECAARLALRSDAKLANAAVEALARWSDNTALSALASVAEKAAVAPVREGARTAAIRYLERNREPWSPATTALIARLSAAASDPGARKPLLGLLARADDREALKLAESLQADGTLAAEAGYAAGAIRAALAGAPVARASRMAGVGSLFDGKTSSRWNTPLLGEEWVEIDFRATRPLRRITLDQTGRAAEFPEQCTVHVTNDPAQPGPAVVQGKGQRGRTVIDFPSGTAGRYVVIKNTAERADPAWSISEIYVD